MENRLCKEQPQSLCSGPKSARDGNVCQKESDAVWGGRKSPLT